MAGNGTVVIGASGIIGGAHIAGLLDRKAGPVTGIARRPPRIADPAYHSWALDLLAADGSTAPPDGLPLDAATHLVFAGFIDAPGWQAQREPNNRLFQATLDFAERHCPSLRHITLVQGMKAYGSHLGPFKTPAQESDPRIPEGHFYFDQQDMLEARAAERGWAWTAIRPHVVIGPARRSPQNLAAVIGVYASLCKAQDLPLTFPGPRAAFNAIYQATDAGLLSQALQWAGGTDAARGEVFNITNGDLFRWSTLWPQIADLFGMAWGGPSELKLADIRPGTDGTWNRLVERHGLEPNRLDDLVSWPFADYVFGTTWDVMADTTKCRKAGFLEFVDSEQMMLERLDELRRLKIIP